MRMIGRSFQMSEIRILPLGAGQDVGRSCILITMGGKNIMLDCGLHMGFHDDVRHSLSFSDLRQSCFRCSAVFRISR